MVRLVGNPIAVFTQENTQHVGKSVRKSTAVNIGEMIKHQKQDDKPEILLLQAIPRNEEKIEA